MTVITVNHPAQGPGLHRAVVQSVEEVEVGYRLKIVFRSIGDDGAIFELSKTFQLVLSPTSSLGNLFACAGIAVEPGASVELNDLIGKSVKILVKEMKNGQDRYIDGFKPGDSQ